MLIVFAALVILPSCYAQDSQLKDQLSYTKTIVLQATRIETARLLVVNAEEAKSRALKSIDRIAGYPIEGELVKVNNTDVQKLVQLILDDENYGAVRQRCRNTYLMGLRFTSDTKIAEFALSMPCQQVIWATKADSKVDYYGAVLGTQAAQEIISILEKKKLTNISSLQGEFRGREFRGHLSNSGNSGQFRGHLTNLSPLGPAFWD
jgi:hypothetical protein